MKLTNLLTAAAALLLMASCSNKSCDKSCDKDKECSETQCDKAAKQDLVTYTGVLPAADAEGFDYTLVLDYDSDDCNEGDYTLTVRTVGTDAVETHKGDFTVHTGTPSGSDVKYLKLVPDHADRAADMATSSDDTMYFLVDSDSTLTMTNATLAAPESGLNYTLTRK